MDTFRSEVSQRFWGPLYVIRHAVPKMREGSITFLTGQLASRPAIGSVVTAALHAALETLTKGLALRVSTHSGQRPGGRCYRYSTLGRLSPGTGQGGCDGLPVKRVGTTQDVAGAVVLLMTNGFITGEVLHIDGGGRWV